MADNNLEKELAKLYSELRELDSMDEETACSIYNVDFKHEAESLFREEIASHEKVLREIEECEHREVNHCRTSDKPYLCW